MLTEASSFLELVPGEIFMALANLSEQMIDQRRCERKKKTEKSSRMRERREGQFYHKAPSSRRDTSGAIETGLSFSLRESSAIRCFIECLTRVKAVKY